MGERIVLRPELAAFAEEMERRLRRKDDVRGVSWRNEDDDWLLDRLHEEVEELEVAMRRQDRSRDVRVIHEAADVANFALFLAAQAAAHIAEEEADRGR